MTKWTLFNAMIHGTEITIGLKSGMVNQIEREDGSGKCFNVTLHTGVKVFVRTID